MSALPKAAENSGSGARYLDPKVSRWLSADPAMGDIYQARL
jgi:hypothetical protein